MALTHTRSATAAAIVFTAFLLLAGNAHPVSAAEQLLVYYDPDSNPQAVVSVTNAFTSYLQKAGTDFRFQPVQRRDKLDELLQAGQVDFVIVSSRVFQDWKGKKLRALLVPKLGSDLYFRKKLVDLKQGPSTNFAAKTIGVSLGDVSVASSSSVLGALRVGGVNVGSASIVPVAKDIDALLALSFGQVESALVTQNSIGLLARINPGAAASLRTVYESEKILRSPLCSILGSSTSSSEQSLVTALLHMQDDEQGRKTMKTMGFDAWVEPPQGISER